MVKSSKKIDDNEIINPKTIKVFDFLLTSLTGIFKDEDAFLSLSLSLSSLRRFEKSLFTLKKFK